MDRFHRFRSILISSLQIVSMASSSVTTEADDMDKVLTSYFDKTVNSNTIKVDINLYSLNKAFGLDHND